MEYKGLSVHSIAGFWSLGTLEWNDTFNVPVIGCPISQTMEGLGNIDPSPRLQQVGKGVSLLD